VSEVYKQDIYDNAPIGIFTSSPDGRIISANAALAKMFGYESPEKMITSITDIASHMCADPADREEMIGLAKEHGEVLSRKCRFHHREGNEFWGAVNVHAIRDNAGHIAAYQEFIVDITEQKKAHEKLKNLEWMLSGKPVSDISGQTAVYDQGYGDLTELNRDGLILKSIERELLGKFADEYLELLGTSSAIYEANGDYAFGIFTSGWCRMMDRASRNLCNTEDNAEALASGKWLCHESCWEDCSRRAIAEGAPVDIACSGGIRLYAVPILAYGKVVGAINFGYGDPPDDPQILRKLSSAYKLDLDELTRTARSYNSRPSFMIELAKKRLHASAQLIGSMIETKQAEEVQRKNKEILHATLRSIGDAVISTDMNGRIVSMNPVAESLTGWDNKEAVGEPLETVFCIINEQTRQPVENPASIVLESGHTVGLANHTLLIAKDGREIPIADSCAPIRSRADGTAGVVLVFRDQSNERAARKALQESEARFRSIFNSMATGVARFSLDFCIEAANQAYCAMLGYTEKELIGEHLKEITAPEVAEENLRNQQLLSKGEIDHYRMEKTFIHKDGNKIYGLLDANLIRDANGKPAYFLSSVVDITEHKRYEEALLGYRNLLDNSQRLGKIGGWEWDLGQQMMSWTDETYRIHDLEPSEVLVGAPEHIQRSLSCYDPKDRGVIEETFYRCVEGGIPYDLEVPFTTVLGQKKWVRTVAQAVMEGDRIVKVIGNIMDITDRKLAQQTLSKSEEKFRSLFNQSTEGIYLYDLEGCILDVNEMACLQSGYSREELLQLTVFDIHANKGTVYLPHTRAPGMWTGWEPGQRHMIETEYKRKNGSVYPVDISSGIVNFEDESAVMAIVKDITERRQVEEALRLSERNSSFLTTAAFELVELTSIQQIYSYTVQKLHALFGENSIITLAEYNNRTNRWKMQQTAGIGKNAAQLSRLLGFDINKMEGDIPTKYYDQITSGKVEELAFDFPGLFNNKLPASVGNAIAKLFSVKKMYCIAFKQDGEIMGNITLISLKRTKPFNIKLIEAFTQLVATFVKKQKSEEKIREKDIEFRKLSANLPDLIYQFTRRPDGSYFVPTASEGIKNIFGCKPEDVADNFDAIARVLHPDDTVRVINDIEYSAEHLTYFTCEFRVLIPGRPVQWILSRSTPEKLPDGCVTWYGFNANITQQKKVEEELRESESRFKALHNASFGGIAIHDKGVILECNQGLSKMTGYGYTELIGMDGLLLIAEKFRETVMNNIRAGYEKPYEVIGLRKNGEEYPVRLEARNIPFKGKKVRVVEFRDITDQKRAEEENKELQEQLSQAQKMDSVGRLAGGVAHDFNNMLSAIIGYAELILESVDNPTSPIFQDVEEILKAANRSAELTRQLLAFSRKQTIAPIALDVNVTIEQTLNMIRKLIGEDIDLVWLPDSSVTTILMDPSQLDQVLANLCINARDAIHTAGKITIETTVAEFDEEYCCSHVGFRTGEFVMLAVSDNGCGMDRDTVDKIFEPFFSLKGAKGTGLGMSTVYGIVKQNDGFINVYSELGKGTTIKIYFPKHAGKSSRHETSSAGHIRKGQGQTILLVEDEKAIRNMAQSMLERLGYQVLAAENPHKAIEFADAYREDIALLLTDVVMPDMNGRELSGRLQKLCPNLQTLFMSGYTANVIAHQGVLDKGIHFIQKPFSIKELSAKVSVILQK
jgi:PAS domain S-box-containing protein